VDRARKTIRWSAEKQIETLTKFFKGRTVYAMKHPAKKEIMALNAASMPEPGSSRGRVGALADAVGGEEGSSEIASALIRNVALGRVSMGRAMA
jgi:hypothetical protein